MNIQVTESKLEIEAECNIERELNVPMLTKAWGGMEPPQHVLEKKGKSQISVHLRYDWPRQRIQYTIKRYRSEEPYKEQSISLYEEELDAMMDLLSKVEDYKYVREMRKDDTDKEGNDTL